MSATPIRLTVLPAALALVIVWAGAATAEDAPAGGKPFIERFEPTSGLPGTTVTIYGNNFTDQYTIWLGTTQLQVTSVVSNRITVKIPSNGKSGHFVLKGKHIVESEGTFSVLEPKNPPTVTSFTPTSGAPGTKVVISGTNFGVQTFDNSVMLGNIAVTVMSSSPDQVKVVIPKGAVTGKFQITVTNGGMAESTGEFSVIEPFAVESFSPTQGAPGDTVTLTGSGFGSNVKNLKVTLAGIECKITTADPHEIEVVLPESAIGGAFAVTLKGEAKPANAPGAYSIIIPPKVEKVSPIGGFPGTVVTITGKHFGTDSIKLRVKLGDQIIKILSFNDTRIEAQIPSDAKTGKITVEVQGRGGMTYPDEFEVWVPLKILAFSPQKGEVGATVVIKGQGFGLDVAKIEVTLGGLALGVLALTDEQVQVQIPDKALSGYFQVSVADRGAPVIATTQFKVVYAPEVTSFDPMAGKPGTLLTVKGKNFGTTIDDIRVLIGPKDKQQYCIVSKLTETDLTCQIQPSTATGPVAVLVKGMGDTASQDTFEVWEPVTVTGFSPEEGLPGTMVTINGTGFVTAKNATTVALAGKPLKVKTVTTDSIVVQIPDKGVGSGEFTVTVKERGTAVSMSQFMVVLPTKITGISPASGPVGTVVTIKGQGFGMDVNQVAVTLLGLYCSVTSVSGDEIKVMVPEGLADNLSGKFQLIVTTGGTAESPKAFKVTKPKTK